MVFSATTSEMAATIETKGSGHVGDLNASQQVCHFRLTLLVFQ
jgi:hypothetical protein